MGQQAWQYASCIGCRCACHEGYAYGAEHHAQALAAIAGEQHLLHGEQKPAHYEGSDEACRLEFAEYYHEDGAAKEHLLHQRPQHRYQENDGFVSFPDGFDPADVADFSRPVLFVGKQRQQSRHHGDHAHLTDNGDRYAPQVLRIHDEAAEDIVIEHDAEHRGEGQRQYIVPDSYEG